MSGEMNALLNGFLTGRSTPWTWGPIVCETPAGDRVRFKHCCDGGHATVAAAKAHAQKVEARIRKTGR